MRLISYRITGGEKTGLIRITGFSVIYENYRGVFVICDLSI